MNVQSSKDILTALVGFDTVSRNSNLDLIAWVEQYLDRHGVKHERIYDETGKKSNLWATLGPADELVLLTPFLPSPLIEKLGSEGFHARPERRSDGAWETHFARE